MKGIVMIFAFLSLIAVSCGAIDIGDTDTIKSTIDAQTGKEFIIALPSNPTTGYSWELAKPLNSKRVEFVRSKYINDFDHLIGSGGKEIWTFKALTPGKTKILFRYVRPWAKKALMTRKGVFTIVIK